MWRLHNKADDPVSFIADFLLSQSGKAASSQPATDRSVEGLQRAMSPPGRGRTNPLRLELHTKARSQENPDYPSRVTVSDEQCRWAVEWPEYSAVDWTHKVVLANDREASTGHKWADPPDFAKIRAELEQRTHARGVVLVRGHLQGGHAVIVGGVGLRARRTQEVHAAHRVRRGGGCAAGARRPHVSGWTCGF